MKLILGILVIVSLAGCATAETFANKCKSYGFQPGTSEFAQCAQAEQQAYSQALRNLGQQISQQSQPAPVTRTNCTKDLMGYSCTTR